MWSPHYDIIIVGAGVAGSSLAHALSTLPQPRRILLLERSLAEPDRIVGELLQPGGISALQKLGMEDCIEGIDAIKTYGYCVTLGGRKVEIPYPGGKTGVGFHHGRFIMQLRRKALEAQKEGRGVEVVEATVGELIECPMTGRVLGVRATRKPSQSSASEDGPAPEPVKESFYADLTIIADGCFSNFRTSVLAPTSPKAETKSHFVGLVLEDANLPLDKHGNVVLVKGSGPVLLYQIAEHDTRMLVDVKAPLPGDLKEHITTHILPQLPPALHDTILKSLASDRLRRMPNSFLPPAPQHLTLPYPLTLLSSLFSCLASYFSASSSPSPKQNVSKQGKEVLGGKEGVFLLGDAYNMRHPLTGGGMMCAFNDVVILKELLGNAKDLSNWDEMKQVLSTWFWRRKKVASVVNVLSVALYDLFGADDPCLTTLRTGCFTYFQLGGACIDGPVSLLAGIDPSFEILFTHFFAVAFWSIYVLFTRGRPVEQEEEDADGESKEVWKAPSVGDYPGLVVHSFNVFWTACVVFLPLMWTEVRWW